MLGGVIGGYCASGRLTAATAPARVMTMDSTAAKIGRSIKKCENMAPPLWSPGVLVGGDHLSHGRLRRLRRLLRRRPDLDLRPDALHAGDDHPLALPEALLALLALLGRPDHPQPLERLA